jgi:hypothetical protein
MATHPVISTEGGVWEFFTVRVSLVLVVCIAGVWRSSYLRSLAKQRTSRRLPS